MTRRATTFLLHFNPKLHKSLLTTPVVSRPIILPQLDSLNRWKQTINQSTSSSSTTTTRTIHFKKKEISTTLPSLKEMNDSRVIKFYRKYKVKI
jgi:hypothetical protein